MKKKISGEQTFTEGAVALLASTFLVKLISAFFKVPLSADFCLGDLGFGYFTSVYDIYTPIYTLAVSGFPVAISKIVSARLAEGAEEKAERTVKLFKRLMLILGIIGFLAVLILAVPMARLTDTTGKTAYIMAAMAPAVIFCCLSSVYRGAFEAMGNMNPTAVSSIIEALSKVFLGFVTAFIVVRVTNSYYLGAAAAMLGITFGTLLSFVFLKVFYRKHGIKFNSGSKLRISEETALLKKLAVISLPIVFASFAGSSVSLIDAITVKWQLSGMLENNFADIAESIKTYVSFNPQSDTLPTLLYGVRSKAYTFFYLVPTFVSAFGISALPMITKAYSKGNTVGVGKGISNLLKFSCVLSFPMAFGFIFAGTPVISLLYGGSTAALSGKMLNIYGIAALFAGISMAFTTALQGINRQNTAFLNFAIGIIIKIVFNLLLVGIPELNIFGSAISTVICYIYIAISNFCVLRKSGFVADIKNSFIKPFFAALACGITAFLICEISDSRIVTLLAVAAAAAVYFALLLLFGTFKSEDFEGLPFAKILSKLSKTAK